MVDFFFQIVTEHQNLKRTNLYILIGPKECTEFNSNFAPKTVHSKCLFLHFQVSLIYTCWCYVHKMYSKYPYTCGLIFCIGQLVLNGGSSVYHIFYLCINDTLQCIYAIWLKIIEGDKSGLLLKYVSTRVCLIRNLKVTGRHNTKRCKNG